MHIGTLVQLPPTVNPLTSNWVNVSLFHAQLIWHYLVAVSLVPLTSLHSTSTPNRRIFLMTWAESSKLVLDVNSLQNTNWYLALIWLLLTPKQVTLHTGTPKILLWKKASSQSLWLIPPLISGRPAVWEETLLNHASLILVNLTETPSELELVARELTSFQLTISLEWKIQLVWCHPHGLSTSLMTLLANSMLLDTTDGTVEYTWTPALLSNLVRWDSIKVNSEPSTLKFTLLLPLYLALSKTPFLLLWDITNLVNWEF